MHRSKQSDVNVRVDVILLKRLGMTIEIEQPFSIIVVEAHELDPADTKLIAQ
jgi:hypothetical protein